MTYDEKARIFFGPLGTKAIEQIVTQDCRDLFLSLDEKKTVEAIISFERLNMDQLEAKTFEEVLTVHKHTLGDLLFSKKIVPATYGLSAAGKVQFDALVALVHAPAQTEDPRTVEYKEFKKRADVAQFQTRLAADTEFRQWANASR